MPCIEDADIGYTGKNVTKIHNLKHKVHTSTPVQDTRLKHNLTAQFPRLPSNQDLARRFIFQESTSDSLSTPCGISAFDYGA